MAKSGLLLTREQILGVEDLSYEDVEVLEWGGTVRVGMMTGTERDAFEQEIIVRQGKKVQMNMSNIRAKLAAMCMVDAEGGRLFSEGDVKALGRKSALALSRVVEVAQRLNGLTPEDMEELSGNSKSGQSDGSTSD